MAVYGLDPMRLIQAPGWVVEILEANVERVLAQQLELMNAAAAFPHLKRADRDRIARQLAGIMRVRLDLAPIELVELDPDRAAEWFRQRGWRVQ